jgi:hypothetical protein
LSIGLGYKFAERLHGIGSLVDIGSPRNASQLPGSPGICAHRAGGRTEQQKIRHALVAPRRVAHLAACFANSFADALGKYLSGEPIHARPTGQGPRLAVVPPQSISDWREPEPKRIQEAPIGLHLEQAATGGAVKQTVKQRVAADNPALTAEASASNSHGM